MFFDSFQEYVNKSMRSWLCFNNAPVMMKKLWAIEVNNPGISHSLELNKFCKLQHLQSATVNAKVYVLIGGSIGTVHGQGLPHVTVTRKDTFSSLYS